MFLRGRRDRSSGKLPPGIFFRLAPCGPELFAAACYFPTPIQKETIMGTSNVSTVPLNMEINP